MFYFISRVCTLEHFFETKSKLSTGIPKVPNVDCTLLGGGGVKSREFLSVFFFIKSENYKKKKNNGSNDFKFGWNVDRKLYINFWHSTIRTIRASSSWLRTRPSAVSHTTNTRTPRFPLFYFSFTKVRARSAFTSDDTSFYRGFIKSVTFYHILIVSCVRVCGMPFDRIIFIVRHCYFIIVVFYGICRLKNRSLPIIIQFLFVFDFLLLIVIVITTIRKENRRSHCKLGGNPLPTVLCRLKFQNEVIIV